MTTPAGPTAAAVAATAVARPLVGLGFDGGFAFTGIGAVAYVAPAYVSLGGSVVKTEREAGKQLRVSSDDVRRTVVYYDAAVDAITRLKPVAIGLEDYHVFDTADVSGLQQAARAVVRFFREHATPQSFASALADVKTFTELAQLVRALGTQDRGSETMGRRGRGKAAKTLLVNGAVIAAARAHGVPLYMFMPGDRARCFCNRPRASKEDVMVAVRARVQNVDAEIAARVSAASIRHHAYDGTALAVLAVEAWRKHHAGATGA